MKALREHLGLFGALFFLAAFSALVSPLYALPRSAVAGDMQVALPRFVQVVMAAGDRYLAANLAGFRTLVAATETMGAENFRIQARVQTDAAWLNPAHEDNYYLAAAMLPWNGQLDAAQNILQAASQARPFDWQPAFYYGFNLLHFLKRPEEGAQWLQRAARNTSDELQILQLQQLAAHWVAKGEDLSLAIRVHRAMARETKYKAFAAYLEKRVRRLENLQALDSAIEAFRARFGTLPREVQQLVQSGILITAPVDPFDAEYLIDTNGKPKVKELDYPRSSQ